MKEEKSKRDMNYYQCIYDMDWPLPNPCLNPSHVREERAAAAAAAAAAVVAAESVNRCKWIPLLRDCIGALRITREYLATSATALIRVLSPYPKCR